MPNVLLQGRLAVQKEALLRVRLGKDWEITTWQPGENPLEDFAHMAAEADIVIGGGIPLETWPAVPKLKLFQIPWTGHEWTSAERMPKGVPVCNTFEHEICIAEYVLAGMLEWQVGLRRMDAEFKATGWGGRPVATGPQHGELYGKTIGVVGYGHIGHEVAVRCKAFGMKVVGVRRSEPPCPSELEWLGTMERLDELLEVSDFVLVAAGLNDETRGLIDAARLGRMKPTGVIINVARGAIIDEPALYAALKEKRIGGAIIDVWYNYQEPGQPDVWPSNLPFQELDNIICSAHESASTQEQVERRWDFIAMNLQRVMQGVEPRNLLYYGTGG